MFCGKCGTENGADFKFCKNCRNPIGEKRGQGNQPQRQEIDVDPDFRDYLKHRFKVKPDEGILAVEKGGVSGSKFYLFVFWCSLAICFVLWVLSDIGKFNEEGWRWLLWLGMVGYGLMLSGVIVILSHVIKARKKQFLVVTTERIIGQGGMRFDFDRGLGGFCKDSSFDVPYHEIKELQIWVGSLFVTTKICDLAFWQLPNFQEIIPIIQREMLRVKTEEKESTPHF